MHDLAFLPHLTGFAVQPLRIDAERVDLRATAIQRWAACPVCRRPSSRVHSRYERHVADLPWNRARVVLHVLARRFRCAFAECPRRIFCERLPALAAVYARCTNLLATLLQMHDCECATAADGLDCLDYLANNERPDIVLLDMGLPRCDGPQTVRLIRENPQFRGLKVFSLSGKSPQEVGLTTGPNGVDGWFAKPVNPKKLWEAIQEALKGSAN